jgi:hypothetical protein
MYAVLSHRRGVRLGAMISLLHAAAAWNAALWMFSAGYGSRYRRHAGT